MFTNRILILVIFLVGCSRFAKPHWTLKELLRSCPHGICDKQVSSWSVNCWIAEWNQESMELLKWIETHRSDWFSRTTLWLWSTVPTFLEEYEANTHHFKKIFISEKKQFLWLEQWKLPFCLVLGRENTLMMSFKVTEAETFQKIWPFIGEFLQLDPF